MKLSIITVNYNGLDDTCALIESIPFDTMPMEVIVVDNGSRRDEAAVIASRYPQVKAIRSETNLGFAGGNNLGIKAATGDYLFLVNNDTVMQLQVKSKEAPHQSIEAPHQSKEPQEGLKQLIQRMEENKKTGIVCPKIRFAWSPMPIQFAGYTKLSAVTLRNHAIGFGEEDHGQHDTPHPTPYAHGAAMLVRREALDSAGLMPECYFLYYEELDWSLRFQQAGYEIWYDPCLTIYHKESQTTGQDSPLKAYYTSRNRLLFASRNVGMPQRLLSYLYLTGIVVPRDIIRYLFTRRPAQARAILRGVYDFIKH